DSRTCFLDGQGGPYGEGTVARCALGENRAPYSAATSQAQGWPAFGTRPQLFAWHSLRSQDRHTLGVPSPDTGMRLRHDLLAAAPRLVASGHLEAHLAGAPGRTWLSRRHRLVKRRSRQLLSACRFWGAKTGPNPTDRGKAGSKRHLITDGNGTPL